MRDLLQWHGLGWDGPPDEGLVFALGGDLGLSYLRSDDLVPPMYLVGRGADFEIDLPRRLGGQVEVLTTDDPAEGWSWVRDDIDAGRPSLVWADIAELPYLRVKLQMSRHDIVVIGYDEIGGLPRSSTTIGPMCRRSRSTRSLGRDLPPRSRNRHVTARTESHGRRHCRPCRLPRPRPSPDPPPACAPHRHRE